MADNSNKSNTTTSYRAIAPDGGIASELLVGGVHADFGILHTGDQHMVTVNEVLQFCMAVVNACLPQRQVPEW